MKKILCIMIGLASLTAFAQNSQKCMDKAGKVILKKGQSRGETATLRWITPIGETDKYEGYNVFVTVNGRNVSYDQVCRIIMKKSNCSYDNTYGCASTLEELDYDY